MWMPCQLVKERPFDEVHVLWAEAHRLPVEAAFQEQWAAGVGGALEALLQLGFEAVELLRRQIAVAGGVDQRAGGPRGVVEEGLVPLEAVLWMSMAVAAASMGERP